MLVNFVHLYECIYLIDYIVNYCDIYLLISCLNSIIIVVLYYTIKLLGRISIRLMRGEG